MDDRDIGFALSVRSDDLSPQAADYIERLEAVVRAGDEMRHAIIGGAGGLKRIATAHAYDTARSRVNLSTGTERGKEASDGGA